MYKSSDINLNPLLIIAGTALVIWGLGRRGAFDSTPKPEPTPEKTSITSQLGTEYIIDVIDGCEYLRTKYRGNSLAHKGNCTNTIHSYNK